MKALLFYEHGNLDRVSYADAEMPQPGPEEVLVAIRAAALNGLDLWVLEGWPGLKLKLPHVMGSDGSGDVAAVGERVTDFAPGDRVAINPSLSCGHCSFCRRGEDNLCDHFAIIGEHVDGFFAEYTAVPARNLLRLPDHVSYVDAAAASLVFVTAWHSLITCGRLQAGESVLVIGAGGGVNTASIQIARLAGAGPIYVVGSSDEKLERAAALGADVTIHREKEDWGKAIFKATNRRGVDVVVDNVGAATYFKSLRSLRRGGRMLTVGNTSGARFEFDNRLMFGKHLSIIGSTMGPVQDYVTVMQLMFEGKLKPVIDTVYPLADGVTALRRMAASDMSGKLILEP